MAKQQAKADFINLYADDELEIVQAKREPMRIEIDRTQLSLRDVVALRKIQGNDEMSEDEALVHFLPIIDKCLVGDTKAEDIPLPYFGKIVELVVGELFNLGQRTKN